MNAAIKALNEKIKVLKETNDDKAMAEIRSAIVLLCTVHAKMARPQDENKGLAALHDMTIRDLINLSDAWPWTKD